MQHYAVTTAQELKTDEGLVNGALVKLGVSIKIEKPKPNRKSKNRAKIVIESKRCRGLVTVLVFALKSNHETEPKLYYF